MIWIYLHEIAAKRPDCNVQYNRKKSTHVTKKQNKTKQKQKQNKTKQNTKAISTTIGSRNKA